MKRITQGGWQDHRPHRKDQAGFNHTTALGSLAVALLAYILYHIYPLIDKGVFW